MDPDGSRVCITNILNTLRRDYHDPNYLSGIGQRASQTK